MSPYVPSVLIFNGIQYAPVYINDIGDFYSGFCAGNCSCKGTNSLVQYPLVLQT